VAASRRNLTSRRPLPRTPKARPRYWGTGGGYRPKWTLWPSDPGTRSSQTVLVNGGLHKQQALVARVETIRGRSQSRPLFDPDSLERCGFW